MVALALTSIFLSARSCASWLTELNFGMHLARSMVRAFNKRQGFDMAGKLRPASLPTTINYEFPLHRLSHWHRYQRMLHTRQYGSVWAGDIPRGATTCVRPVELKGSRLSFAISRAGNFRRDFPLLPGKFIELRNLASRVHQDRARRRLHVRGAGRGLALRACAGDCTCNARPPPRNPREASTRLNRPTERDQLRSLERLMPLIEDDVLLRSLLAEWLSAEGYRVTDKA